MISSATSSESIARAAAAADLLREADAEQVRRGRRAVQLAGERAGVLPGGEVRHDLGLA